MENKWIKPGPGSNQSRLINLSLFTNISKYQNHWIEFHYPTGSFSIKYDSTENRDADFDRIEKMLVGEEEWPRRDCKTCKYYNVEPDKDPCKGCYDLNLLWEQKDQEPVVDPYQPDWSESPEWANWWAVDKCGEAWWFIDKPEVRGDLWDTSGVNMLLNKIVTNNSDWKNSLRKRPD